MILLGKIIASITGPNFNSLNSACITEIIELHTREIATLLMVPLSQTFAL